MSRLFIVFLLLFAIPQLLLAQSGRVFGTVTDTLGNPVPFASVNIPELERGIITDSLGNYQIVLPAGKTYTLQVDHINFRAQSTAVMMHPSEMRRLDIRLEHRTRILENIELSGRREAEARERISVTELEPAHIGNLPAPFSDISTLLSTLPGVISNNELSSSYSVRGGSFEENLVYVNEIPVYRPFLVRAGQQEGMSFVNPDLTGNVEFSSGGWEPKFGDKLSSNLNVTYKKPDSLSGSLSGGLLGGSVHLEGSSADKKLGYLIGVRQKRTEYLLNTLDVKGSYKPRFTDFQGFFQYQFGKNPSKNSTSLELLAAYSNNRYEVTPENRVTSFGTFNTPLSLFVAFDGQEIMKYDTWEGAVKIIHRFSSGFVSKLILSDFYTREREYFDIEAGYRLCDVDKRLNSPTFNQCLTLRGIGTNYNSARNRLDGNVTHAEWKNEIKINGQNNLEFGIGYTIQHFEDRLHEYSFDDSADYVTVTDLIDADNDLSGTSATGYLQNRTVINSFHTLIYGTRFNYLSINKQWLISPRIQYAFHPVWKRDVVFKAAAGLYRQPPLYREFRRLDGSLNKDVRAQSAFHLIGGMDYLFRINRREFRFITEMYYKYLWDVIPYDVNNIRLRYYAENQAHAFATGLDFRISGEFVEGDESWFSLGILTTREDLDIDNRGYIPRPTDQFLNFNIFFQDHIPENPSYRVYLNLNFATGLPFGPPGNPNTRNIFRGDSYQRADIGLSRIFYFAPQSFFETFKLGVEILNITGRDNSITYFWVRDFNNTSYGIPNSLTSRFFNIKIVLKF